MLTDFHATLHFVSEDVCISPLDCLVMQLNERLRVEVHSAHRLQAYRALPAAWQHVPKTACRTKAGVQSAAAPPALVSQALSNSHESTS